MASMKKIILEQKEENEKLKNNVLILVDLSEELKKSMDKDGENLKKFQGFYDIKKKKLSKSQKKCFNLEKEIKDLKERLSLKERISEEDTDTIRQLKKANRQDKCSRCSVWVQEPEPQPEIIEVFGMVYHTKDLRKNEFGYMLPDGSIFTTD